MCAGCVLACVQGEVPRARKRALARTRVLPYEVKICGHRIFDAASSVEPPFSKLNSELDMERKAVINMHPIGNY